MPFWLLGRAARTAGQVTQERLVEQGLRRYAYGILATLDEFGPAAQAEIGRRLGVDPSDMVAALNDLEADSLLTRERDARDKRRNIIALTDAGMIKLREFDAAIAAAQGDYLAGLTGTERETFVRLLQRVAFPQPAEPDDSGPVSRP